MFYFFLSKGVTNVLLITQLLYYVEPVIKPLTYTQKVLASLKKTGFLFPFFFFLISITNFLVRFQPVGCSSVHCPLHFTIQKEYLQGLRQILKWCKTAIATFLSKLRIRLEETWSVTRKDPNTVVSVDFLGYWLLHVFVFLGMTKQLHIKK